MVAKKDEEAEFIPGIFNYCDRWCERCSMTSKCSLFYRESQRRAEHQEKGEDPDDWDIVLKDVQDDLQEAIQMCTQMAAEQGVDLKLLEEEEDVEDDIDQEPKQDVDLSEHPLRNKAHAFAMDCHRFLDLFCSLIQEEERKGVDPAKLVEAQDCFQIISWYHMQIAVKIDRALRGNLGSETEDESWSEAAKSDSDGSAKVAYLGMTRVLDSLTKVHEWNKALNSDIMPLLNTLYELIDDLNNEFPDHAAFKRPGFDE